MSINLLETIQQNLGYPTLHKMSPNAQKAETDAKIHDEDKLEQAAVPAVLAGFCKYVQTDDGAVDFLHGNDFSNWVGKIFNDNENEAIESISTYAGKPKKDIIVKMNAIADETVKVVKESLPVDATIKEVKVFFSNQKNNILLYLPNTLNMGQLLHDNTLDDNTNKMEGPISSLIQSIGAAFSSPAIDEETKN